MHMICVEFVLFVFMQRFVFVCVLHAYCNDVCHREGGMDLLASTWRISSWLGQRILPWVSFYSFYDITFLLA